jgi:hypothetical protein
VDYKEAHSAIRWNKIDVVRAIVVDAEDANATDPNNGNRCLHVAAQNGHSELVRRLLDLGADPSAANAQGQTPMHMTVSYDIADCTKLLLRAGADPDARNDAGHAAKHGLEGEMDRGSGAFYLTLVPIRPRRRGERRSLRTFPGVSLRPPLAFNPDTPRRLSTPFLTPFNSTPTSL